MILNYHDAVEHISRNLTLVGRLGIYFDGENTITDRNIIIAKVKKDPRYIRYVVSDSDLILHTDEKIEIYSSAQSSGIFFRILEKSISISKDDRCLMLPSDHITAPDFKHQIMFRKFDMSFLCNDIKRNSPLLITSINTKNKISTRINLDINNNVTCFHGYYENLWRLCLALSSEYKSSILFSGGIDSALMAYGAHKKTDMVHYAYKDFVQIEQKLSIKVANALGRELRILESKDGFDPRLFDEYSKHILPCVIDYKLKFNWIDDNKNRYLLTGQNADSFIYGDSFNKSNLRGQPGRFIINILTILSRLKYLLFSYLYIKSDTALKLFYYGSINDENEHTTLRIIDFINIFKSDVIPQNSFTEAILSLPDKKMTVLTWIKIFKVFRILHNVNYNGRAINTYNGSARINPYSSAYMIEQALFLKYSFLTVLIPKYQSFKIFRSVTHVSFFKLLNSSESWISSIKKRSKKDSIIADEKIRVMSEEYGIKENQKQELMKINFQNWLKK